MVKTSCNDKAARELHTKTKNIVCFKYFCYPIVMGDLCSCLKSEENAGEDSVDENSLFVECCGECCGNCIVEFVISLLSQHHSC